MFLIIKIKYELLGIYIRNNLTNKIILCRIAHKQVHINERYYWNIDLHLAYCTQIKLQTISYIFLIIYTYIYNTVNKGVHISAIKKCTFHRGHTSFFYLH